MDIARRFQEVAKKYPQKPFIIFKTQSISYAETAKRVNKLAHALDRQGIKKGEKIAVYLPNCPEYVFSYLAVFNLGAACVPLDVRLTNEELIGVLNHSEASIVITKPLAGLSFTGLKEKAPGLKNIIKCFTDAQEDFLSFTQIMQEESEKQPSAKIDQQNLATLYYTSGTTGKPKAVMSNYRSLDNPTQTTRYLGFDEKNMGEVEICALPLSHIGGFDYILFALEYAMTIVLMERFIPIEFLKNIERHKGSWFHIVPSMFTALLQLKEFEKFNLKSVVGVCVFGAF
ncbi:MAG: long-chain fatty acid--CoA ligase, partial [Omnitrophica bacterium]|nr:long-chain fatty acid--CoA ligase [Candidatus Omnitrophota bacterium]